jgi:hypothetical protein
LNKNEIAIEEIEKGINIMVKRAILPYTNQFMTGIIISNGSDEGYKININSIEYDNILSLGSLTLSTNDTVVAIAPNGQTNNIFILGKLG